MANPSLPQPQRAAPLGSSPSSEQNTSQETLDQEIEKLSDTRGLTKLAFWVLGVGLGGFVLWAALAPLDEGVPTQGTVTVDTKRKAVQHPTGGVIAEILVREGEFVQKDQVLIRLGDTSVKASFERAQSDLSSFRENLLSQRVAIAGYQELRASRETQLKLLNDELRGIEGLVADGYAPENQLRDLQRRVSELRSNLIELDTAEERARRTIAEVQFRIEAAQKLVAVAQKDLDRIDIRSPASGQVIGLQVQTIGGVVQGAQRLMDIVPKEEELILETQIQPALIDRVAVNDPVDIRFSSFAHSPQLVVEGFVESISQDILMDERTRAPYYLARVNVSPTGLKTLGSRRMQPGMPVEVIVKTGRRTLLEYLLHPLTRRVSASLKEE